MTTSAPVSATVPPAAPAPGPAPAPAPAAPAAPGAPGELPGGLRVVRETAGGYLLLVPQGTSPGDLPPELLPPGGPPPDLSAPGPSASGAPASGAGAPGGPPPGPGGEGVHIDRGQHTVHLDGAELALTYLEFELLAHLAEHPHRVHSREHLVSTVWGYAHHIGDGRTVDVHVARLRRKLGPRYRRRIVTIRRVGYKYTP